MKEHTIDPTAAHEAGNICNSRDIQGTASDPRETMTRLPGWMQPLLTELTGKAAVGESPAFRWSTGARYGAVVLEWGTGVGAGMAFAGMGGGWLAGLPVAWLLTVGASRAFQVAAGVHHASHKTLFRLAMANEIAGEAAALLAWVSPLETYREAHRIHHARPAAADDDDLRFLVDVAGLQPGLDKKAYWKWAAATLVSPAFHLRYLSARFRSQWQGKRPAQRWAARVWWVLVALATAATGAWWPVLAGYLFPVLLLQQMAAWVGMLGLHTWARREAGAEGRRAATAELTHARFVGEATPPPGLRGVASAAAWTGWAARMALLHIPSRIAFVQGDLPSHDLHHMTPGEDGDWANHAYRRRDAVRQGDRMAPLFTEVWGVFPAIHATFDSMGRLPKEALTSPAFTRRELDARLASM